MKFHISMNDDDYIEFNNFLAFNTKAGKGAITRGRFLGLAISAVIMLVLFIAKADNWLIIPEIGQEITKKEDLKTQGRRTSCLCTRVGS